MSSCRRILHGSQPRSIYICAKQTKEEEGKQSQHFFFLYLMIWKESSSSSSSLIVRISKRNLLNLQWDFFFSFVILAELRSHLINFFTPRIASAASPICQSRLPFHKQKIESDRSVESTRALTALFFGVKISISLNYQFRLDDFELTRRLRIHFTL